MSKGKSKVTPMMQQYLDIKEKHPNTILVYRMGDFYELFNDDAIIASKLLGITLTSRNHGGTDKTPLAGFPHHALDRYANKLVHAGHKIAICEQVEDPKEAKGLVKRDVVEIITSGTATEDNFIDDKSNNYIISVYRNEKKIGISLCDLSTGEFKVEEIDEDFLEEEITRIDPQEMLLPTTDHDDIENMIRTIFPNMFISSYDTWKFHLDYAEDVLKEHFKIASLQGIGLEGYSLGLGASGALLAYLKEQKKNDLRHISRLTPRSVTEYAELDPASIRNLELLRPLQTGDSGGTLISVMDKTVTSMGARLLKNWITHPLKNITAINERLDAVEWLKDDIFVRNELSGFLKGITDIERLISRITFERANARDLISLKNSLKALPELIEVIQKSPCKHIKGYKKHLTKFDKIAERIEGTIIEEPPLSITGGGFIKPGISEELDEITDASRNGKQWIANLVQTERERTGISTLKVNYNKVFGYYIEVSKANSDLVPEEYIRKQTLVNAERFITPDLKEMENKILGAEERLSSIEQNIFIELRKETAQHCERIQKAAEVIAELDVYLSLGTIASENRYCRPKMLKNADLHIKEGRHPVVEVMNPNDQFVANDAELVTGKSQVLLITGPNMAGKSTYLRQNALIAVMAQIGSFVPADEAEIGVVDKFFTRVGASDRLARGQSTFLVEMIEVANILNNATDKSFVLLDEVGRGTSTFDGISIAWAVSEFLHENKGSKARTFFATHYHELADLEKLFPRIKNLHIKVKEWNDEIIFLRKIGEGNSDHSYGIQVARLAGVPDKVINRAKQILVNLEQTDLSPEINNDKGTPKAKKSSVTLVEEPNQGLQVDLFGGVNMDFMTPDKTAIINKVKKIDVNSLTPMEALNTLQKLQEQALGLDR